MKQKVNHAISNNEPLLCIGFQLPDFSLSDLSIRKEFTKPVYFNGSQFFGIAEFARANFEGGASFGEAKFKGGADFLLANFQGFAFFSYANFQGRASFDKANFEEANFWNSEFYSKTYFSGNFNGTTNFNYVLFEGKEKVIFDIENLSNVSFMNTDLTEVRFSDKARWGEKKVEYDKFWGGQKVKEDRFKIVDGRLLEEEIKRTKKKNVKPAIENERSMQEDESHDRKMYSYPLPKKDGNTTDDINLGSIKAVYRNLRENYEYRMRYDEAGQFFIREMELKRKYREVVSKEEHNEIKQNNWFRRNLFSLTGWYYHLSRYGESIWRPALAG
jgi:hypothetical protein